MTYLAPRPGRSYNERDESNFRATLELYLRTLDTSGGSSAPFPIDITFNAANANATSAATPAALDEWNGQKRQRTRVNLTGYTTAEFTSYITGTGPANVKIRVQYTTDLTGASGWAYLDGSTGPSLAAGTQGSVQTSVTLTAAAQADVLIRLVSIDGDAATTTALGITRIRFS